MPLLLIVIAMGCPTLVTVFVTGWGFPVQMSQLKRSSLNTMASCLGVLDVFKKLAACISLPSVVITVNRCFLHRLATFLSKR